MDAYWTLSNIMAIINITLDLCPSVYLFVIEN